MFNGRLVHHCIQSGRFGVHRAMVQSRTKIAMIIILILKHSAMKMYTKNSFKCYRLWTIFRSFVDSNVSKKREKHDPTAAF